MSAHPRSRDGVIELVANPAAAATAELVAAAGTGKKIRILSLKVVSTAANTVTFKSATTAISGADDLAANGGYVLPYDEIGWFETAANEALNVTLSAASKVAITMRYRLVQ